MTEEDIDRASNISVLIIAVLFWSFVVVEAYPYIKAGFHG